MKAGDQILIDGKLPATIRAVLTPDQMQEIAPMLGFDLAERLTIPETTTAVVVTINAMPDTPTMLFSTDYGWKSPDGRNLTVTLADEHKPNG